VKASSSIGPIIDLVDSDLEEEVIASAPVTEEVDQYLQSFTYFLDGDGKKDFIPVSTIPQSSSVSICSYSTLLLSSIHTLSTLPAGGRISPALSELYQDLISTPEYVTSDIVQIPISLPVISEAPIFKILLHLPSVTLSRLSRSEKILGSFHHFHLSISTFHLPNHQPHSRLQLFKQILFKTFQKHQL